MDVLRDIYEYERRFELRDERPAFVVERQPGTGLVEALFGLYPNDEPSTYFAQGYGDVFKPTVVKAAPDIWTKVYMEGAVSPLRLTAHRLERQPTGRDDPKYFVFDPSKATDLIDLWNLRLEPSPVSPYPSRVVACAGRRDQKIRCRRAPTVAGQYPWSHASHNCRIREIHR